MVTESLKTIIKCIFWTKYIKSVLWGVAIRLSYVQDAWCLRVNIVLCQKHFLFLEELREI